MKRFIVVALATAISGCASKGHFQAYEGSLRPDAEQARVLIPSPGNGLVHMLFGTVHTRISCVDGQFTSKPFGYNSISLFALAPEVVVTPGRHNLTLNFEGGGFSGRQTVWFDAEPGRSYYARHDIQGSGAYRRSIHVQVQEQDTGKIISRVMDREPDPADAAVPAEKRCRA